MIPVTNFLEIRPVIVDQATPEAVRNFPWQGDKPVVTNVGFYNSSSNERINKAPPRIEVYVKISIEGKITNDEVKVDINRHIVGNDDELFRRFESQEKAEIEKGDCIIVRTTSFHLDSLVDYSFGNEDGQVEKYYVEIWIADTLGTDRVSKLGGAEIEELYITNSSKTSTSDISDIECERNETTIYPIDKEGPVLFPLASTATAILTITVINIVLFHTRKKRK